MSVACAARPPVHHPGRVSVLGERRCRLPRSGGTYGRLRRPGNLTARTNAQRGTHQRHIVRNGNCPVTPVWRAERLSSRSSRCESGPPQRPGLAPPGSTHYNLTHKSAAPEGTAPRLIMLSSGHPTLGRREASVAVAAPPIRNWSGAWRARRCAGVHEGPCSAGARLAETVS